ncbi:iron complex outermembrane recepter protein [Gammaproteobacteria bacterium]
MNILAISSISLIFTLVASVGAVEIDDLSLEDLVNTKITTASKFSQRVSEAPSSATVIHGEEIRAHGWRNLGEVLVSVPGFEISTATDYRYLGVRGFSQSGDYNSRILLLIDGIPTNDGIFDQALIGPEFPLDTNLIDRIEVVPGPGSALYGGNAYLAVVNVITRQSASIGRSVTLGVGSAGLLEGRISTGGIDATGRHWLISASSEHAHGEDRYFPQWQGIGGSDGWAHDMDSESLRKVFLRYGAENWSLQLLYGHSQKDAAGAMFGTDFSAPVSNLDTTTQIGLRIQRPLSNIWTLEGQAYLGEYRWEGSYGYSGVWEFDRAHSGWLGANVQLTGKPWENQTWVMGAGTRNDYRQDQQNIGGLITSDRRIVSLYAQDDISVSDIFTLNLGGRYDYTFDSSQFNPRGALLVNLPAAMVLKLMLGKAFRPPNAYETNYSYPGSTLAGGNLKPERVATDEIVLEQVIGTHGRWTASLYRNRFSDLLKTITDYNTTIQQVQTSGGAYTKGLELNAYYRFNSGLDLRGSLSWQRSKDEALTDKPLFNSPRQLAKFLAIVPIGGYELGWETYYIGSHNDVFENQVGGQTVSHAALSGRFNRDLRWQLRVSNLFDRKLYTVIGPEYSMGMAGNIGTIPDYGRQLQIHLTLDF